MTETEKKDIEQADKEETEAHIDKEKDEQKDTDDRQKDIDDDTKKADLDEYKAHLEKKFSEYDKKLKELEKRIIDSHRSKTEPSSNDDDGAIGY